MEGLFFVIIIAVVIGSIAWGFHQNNVENGHWAAAAQQLGGRFTPPSGFQGKQHLRMEDRGVSVVAEAVTRGSGDSSERLTRYTLRFPSVGPRVSLRWNNAGSFFKRVFGNQVDVTIGSPAFDGKVVIEALDTAELRRFLSPARQSVALDLFESYRYVEITNSTIQLEERGRIRSPEHLTSTIRRLIDRALVMGAPDDVDRALSKQAIGDLEGAIADLHAMNTPAVPTEPPNSFTQLLEVEADIAAGDGQAAAAVLADIEVTSPELESWEAVAAQHPTPNPTPAPAGPTVDLRQERVIADLLASNRTGSETEDHFFEHYEGQRVQWSGEVDSERPFTFDSNFDGEGVRAVVNVGSLGDGVLITNRVQAIVHLPTGTEVERDDQITVEGTLIRLDRYMRNFYLANAQLVAGP